MFIDYVMNMCDRIIRRAAEENPTSTCLQNIPADNTEKDSSPQKETK